MSRWHHAAAMVVALGLLGVSPAARAEVPVVRWLVPTDGVAEAWRGAAASTWPGGLSVRRWDGDWPPAPDDAGEGAVVVAYLEGTPQRGVLVILGVDEEGVRRLPLEFPDASDPDAMRSVLLILRSSVVPLGVADATDPPALLPPPEDLEAAAVEAPAPDRRGRLRGGIGVGLSYRPGLDTASLTPSGRLALVVGPLERSPLRLLLCGGAELLGRADLAGVSVREDELFAALGVELRPRWRATQIPISVAAGVRVYRAHRTDRTDAETPVGALPTLLLGGGPSWPLSDGLRLEVRAAFSIELVRGDGGPPIRLELTADDQRLSLGLLPVRIGLELALDLGEPWPVRTPVAPKSAGTPVRPPAPGTPIGAEG